MYSTMNDFGDGAFASWCLWPWRFRLMTFSATTLSSHDIFDDNAFVSWYLLRLRFRLMIFLAMMFLPHDDFEMALLPHDDFGDDAFASWCFWRWRFRLVISAMLSPLYFGYSKWEQLRCRGFFSFLVQEFSWKSRYSCASMCCPSCKS